MLQTTIEALFKVTEVELIYRNKIKATERPKVTKSEDAFRILKQSWDVNKIDLQEQFKILLLNSGNMCLGVSEIGSGGMAACIVDPKLIFATALKGKASKIILAHNHPSGSLEPSNADKDITIKAINGGKLLDIAVLDHLIITSDSYKSFADHGLMPF